MTARHSYSWVSIWASLGLVGLCCIWGFHLRAENVQLGADQAVLEKVLDQSGVAIAVSNVQGQAIFHNREFVRLLGWTPSEINAAGGPSKAFVNAEQYRAVHARLVSNQPFSGIVQLYTAKGNVVTMHLQAMNLAKDNGTALGVMGVHEVTTLQAQAR
jgi:PAS domain S-box-containing protein